MRLYQRNIFAQATLEDTCPLRENKMKFENQDAFKMTAAYLERKENLSAASAYFKTFVETYEKFDRWLDSPDPVKTMEDERKAARANPDSLL